MINIILLFQPVTPGAYPTLENQPQNVPIDQGVIFLIIAGLVIGLTYLIRNEFYKIH